jgi:proteic killer suppression protein
MIRSFADPKTEQIWTGERSRKLPSDIQQRAFRKLGMIDAALHLDDLKNPPSNGLHDLKCGSACKKDPVMGVIGV